MLRSGKEFAYRHIETTVAAKRDDLARTVERLDAIGLAQGSTDGTIVEGADDPLLAALADPVARPECVEPGVDDEHRVAFGEIAHRTRNSLRMNPVLDARRIGLLVLHIVPSIALRRDAIEKSAVALWLYSLE